MKKFFRKNSHIWRDHFKTLRHIWMMLIFCIPLWTCNSENSSCSDENEFCSQVKAQNFDATGPLIDNFLSKLQMSGNAQNLDLLKEWLECKSCVKKVSILCNSCIKTNPAQSELSVVFMTNGQSVEKILDLEMSIPPKFRAYHD